MIKSGRVETINLSLISSDISACFAHLPWLIDFSQRQICALSSSLSFADSIWCLIAKSRKRWTWKLTLSTSPFNYARAGAEIESADSSRRVELVGCCRLDRPSSFSPQHHQHSVRTQLKLARNLINLRKVFLHGRSELVSFSFLAHFLDRRVAHSFELRRTLSPSCHRTFSLQNVIGFCCLVLACFRRFRSSHTGPPTWTKNRFSLSARVISKQTNGRNSLADFSICLRFNAQRYRCLSYANGANVSFLLRRSLVRCYSWRP